MIIMMIRGSSRGGIPRVREHLSLIFTSQTVGRQRCAASTEKRRVLPRSSPNIIPHGGGHKRKELKKKKEEDNNRSAPSVKLSEISAT